MAKRATSIIIYSRQTIANNSGHNIEIDQPDAAVAAIVQMVEQVR
jgi:hypothetical protein